MLELNDPRWKQLHGNYTNGDRVAGLLTEANKGTQPEDWYDDLFQELCHQYTVSEAAFPALPHLVALASQNPELGAELLILAASCCTYADSLGSAASPTEFAAEWQKAVADAIPLAAQLLSVPVAHGPDLRYLLFCLASFNGQHPLAMAIESLDTLLTCPNCGFEIERMPPG